MINSKVTEDLRRQMIAEAAYFRAERRGFNGGNPVTDWVEAEAEVDTHLRQMQGAHLLKCLEEGLSIASKKLDSLKRKVQSAKSEARSELQREVEMLSEL